MEQNSDFPQVVRCMRAHNFHILVVDDDEDDRFLINDALYECDMVSEVDLEFAEDGE